MNLIKALFSISSFTFLSRILGFVRDTVVFQVFGVGMATDAFFAANKIPNVLRRIFAEGAFSQAFVPILSEYKSNKTHAETALFIQKVAGSLSFALFIVTIIGIIAAPLIITITSPGFTANPDKFQLTVQLLRITFPYIFFISLTSFLSAILNTYNQFTIPAITPILLNIVLIIFAVFVSPYFKEPIFALAWGVFFAGIVQLLFQMPAIWKLGYLKLPKISLKDPAINRVINAMGIIIIGVSAGQISLILNNIIASYLAEGSVSWLYASDRLIELPTGILGVALGVILLPSLSRFSVQNKQQQYSDLLDWGLRFAFLLALPAAVGLAVLAYPLISTLFYYNKFSLVDVLMTQRAVLPYSIAVLGFILIKILAPGFTSKQDYKTPVKIGIFILFFTQFSNLLLVWYFQLGIVGLNLSIAIAACVNCLLLYTILRKKDYFQPRQGWLWFLTRLVIAVSIMALVLFFLLNQTYYPLVWDGKAWQRVLQLGILVLSGVVVYFCCLAGLGFKAKDFMKRI